MHNQLHNGKYCWFQGKDAEDTVCSIKVHQLNRVDPKVVFP
uniref:Uncharacterized protein n=1 Tax=Rhizophora mucronata TaxID=61149 RepID=A0A2P2QM14_RHIMU